jgi:hypothetical protein
VEVEVGVEVEGGGYGTGSRDIQDNFPAGRFAHILVPYC